MSERDEMAGRIKAVEASDKPRLDACTGKPAVKDGEVHTFACRIGRAPAIYKPWPAPSELHVPGTYGVLTAPEYIPAALRDYVRQPLPSRPDAEYVAVGGGKQRPMVIAREPSKVSLDTLLQCARAANLDFDELLIGAPVEVAVRLWEFEGRFSPLAGSRNQIHRRLPLMAIRIDTDFMAKRYDELCAKYFTGG